MPRRSSLPIALKLLPHLADAFPARAEALGLPTSILLSILVRNDGIRPNAGLSALAQSKRLKRVPLTCSLRGRQRSTARSRARAQKLSLNAYLEALIDAQLARPRGPLTILYG